MGQQKWPKTAWLTGFQIPPPVTSTGSVFSLRLTSDFAVSAHGFKIYYEGLNFVNCQISILLQLNPTHRFMPYEFETEPSNQYSMAKSVLPFGLCLHRNVTSQHKRSVKEAYQSG
ncbi:hypothetical protein NFI96_000927 [Prochilodus magdalenae]|nr:hypothetical protein NFI96_000927 [Prochilodus magdalenae]